MVTITAVHPGARFGELEMKDNQVTSFQEKPQTKQGWINGGYLVIEPEFFDLIEEDQTILASYETIDVEASASSAIKKMDGTYTNLDFMYGVTFDTRNQFFKPSGKLCYDRKKSL